MKRSFSEYDSQIPTKLLERFPHKSQQLKRIIELENEIEDRLDSFRRSALEANCEVKTKPKILRIYIRHVFVPSSLDEKAHFLVTVEGRLLDGTPVEEMPFGLFFDEVKVVPDRKYNIDNMLFEWTKEKFPAGVRAQCFRFKLQCDRTLPVTIRLTRSDYAVKRYETSSGLRQLLPKLPPDPTENEVLLALWEYIQMYDLCPDKSVVRCDENLRRVTEVENITLSSLKTIIIAHLFPCKTIDVEYSVNTISFDDKDVTEKRHGALAYHKSGGKCFDINVDVIDNDSHKILDILNRGSKKSDSMDIEFDKLKDRSSYIVKSLCRCEKDIADLEILSTAPIPVSLLEDGKSRNNMNVKDSMIATHLPECFEDTLPSEMHNLGTYLDVSQDDIFSSVKYKWLTQAAYASSSH